MEKIKQPPQNLGSKLTYWKKSAANLIRMGHCAPTVMQTLLDVSDAQKEWQVKLSAGMPGGIGNTGFECGALTSPLVMMGLRYGLHPMDRDLPVIFDRGHALCQHFLRCHKTLMCRQIRKDDHFPKRCIRPVLLSPQLFMASIDNEDQDVIPPETRESYSRIYSHWVNENFHCAQAVLNHLDYTPHQDRELLDATSAFMGGTLCMGMTCSAFAAGVMVVGLQSGEIENSPPRVIRLLFRMTFGGNAFDEKINKFNRTMNTGYRMSKWFVKEFGSTQCRAITGCDFSTPAGVDQYIEGCCVTRCRQIVEKVAERVRETLANLDALPRALPTAA
jgi:hypothetical protein